MQIYHLDYFNELLKENIVWAIMLYYIPPEFIFKENIKLDFKIRIPSLKKSSTIKTIFLRLLTMIIALMDASHNYAKAKRLWFANDLKKSKKNIVHGLRYDPTISFLGNIDVYSSNLALSSALLTYRW